MGRLQVPSAPEPKGQDINAAKKGPNLEVGPFPMQFAVRALAQEFPPESLMSWLACFFAVAAAALEFTVGSRF